VADNAGRHLRNATRSPAKSCGTRSRWTRSSWSVAVSFRIVLIEDLEDVRRVFRQDAGGLAPGSMTMSTKVCQAQRESSSSRPCRSRHAVGKDGLYSLCAGPRKGEPAFRAVCSLQEARGEEGRPNRLRPPPSASPRQRPHAVHRVALRRPLGRLPLPHMADEDLASLNVYGAVIGKLFELTANDFVQHAGGIDPKNPLQFGIWSAVQRLLSLCGKSIRSSANSASIAT